MRDGYREKIDKDAAEVREPIGTIDLTPTWAAVVGFYLEVLNSDANVSAKEAACSEILRAAKLADLYVKEHKR